MEKNQKPYLKYCAVPKCQNNIKTAPNKVYFFIPRNVNVRKKWCKAMKRDDMACLSSLYCCEDHFNIEKDTKNYMQYKIMALEQGQKVTLRLKKGIVPYLFQCQQKDKLRSPPQREDALKRQRQALAEEALDEAALPKVVSKVVSIHKAGPSGTLISEIDLAEAGPSTASVPCHMDVEMNDFMTSDNRVFEEATSNIFVSKVHSTDVFQHDKAVQVDCKVDCKVHYRSKSVNVNLIAKKNNIALSPFSIPSKNTSTSPLKCAQISSVTRKLFSDNTADVVSVNSQSSVLSTDYEKERSSSDSSWLIEDESDSDLQFKRLMRSGTLIAIEKEPKMFLGLPKQTYYLIKLLSENIPLPTIDILITLRKIKLNESFSLLAINFGYSQSTVSRIFSKSILAISEKMKELIIWPTPPQIYEKLPISFRIRYDNVVSIIDCLEIQIEKPTNAVHQSLTWSQYKKCNTLKYLISCTPDGLVTYISDGYSGRATDVMIVEDCGYLDYLPPQKAVMADRGFKDLTRLLANKNCTLVRPPSVSQATPSTKENVKQSKQIAALRIHIERVIGRLREFNMLLPHACIDHNLISVIDEVIIIACGLINLQDVLIKK